MTNSTDRRVGFESIVSYAPETVHRVEEFGYFAPYLPGPVSDFFPKELRRLARKDAAEILTAEVARLALAKAGLAPADIDLLVVQCTGGQYVCPGLAAHVHHELGFRLGIPCWNVQQVCASFVDACQMAEHALRADPKHFRRALVIVASAQATGTWGVDHTSPAAANYGDGAAAAVVSSVNLKTETLAYATLTESSIYHYLVVDHEGPALPELSAHNGGHNNRAVMRISPKFMEWLATVGRTLPVRLIPEVAERAGLSLSDVDYIVPHQAQAFAIQQWTEEMAKLGFPTDRWRHTWDKYGNVGGVDVPMSFAEHAEAGAFPAGSTVALFAPGGAGHSSTMLIRMLGTGET